MDIINVMNTIRDNASSIYQQRVPVATQTNITQIQEVMTDPNNAVVVNEWISTMLNMIAKVVIHNKLLQTH